MARAEKIGIAHYIAQITQRRIEGFMPLMESAAFCREEDRDSASRRSKCEVGVFRAIAFERFVETAETVERVGPDREGQRPEQPGIGRGHEPAYRERSAGMPLADSHQMVFRPTVVHRILQQIQDLAADQRVTFDHGICKARDEIGRRNAIDVQKDENIAPGVAAADIPGRAQWQGVGRQGNMPDQTAILGRSTIFAHFNDDAFGGVLAALQTLQQSRQMVAPPFVDGHDADPFAIAR